MVSHSTLETLATLFSSTKLKNWLKKLPPETSDVFLHVGTVPKILLADGEFVYSKLPAIVDSDLTALRGLYYDKKNRAGYKNLPIRIGGVYNTQNTLIGVTIRFNDYREFDSFKLLGENPSELGSILFVASPGLGKTTYIRYLSSLLSKDSNVVVIDKSNEIAGDGDIPHFIGNSLRLQVPYSKQFSDVILEAIENHHPHKVIVDEVTTFQECKVLRSAFFRGVDIIASCHGSDISDVINDPELSLLLGGASALTISDSAANEKYDGRKTKLERKFPPIFDTVIVITSFNEIRLYRHLESTVDHFLEGRDVRPEIRSLDKNGEAEVECFQSVILPQTEKVSRFAVLVED